MPPEIPEEMWAKLYGLASGLMESYDKRLADTGKEIEAKAGITYWTFKSEPALKGMRPLYMLAFALVTDALTKGYIFLQIQKEKREERDRKSGDNGSG